MAAIGSVLAMPAAGWLINKFLSLSIMIGSTLGFGLALPLIAGSRTVLTLSVALLFYGAMAGSMDVAMNTRAVMLEKRYQHERRGRAKMVTSSASSLFHWTNLADGGPTSHSTCSSCRTSHQAPSREWSCTLAPTRSDADPDRYSPCVRPPGFRKERP
jgi:hypothetical protein